MSAWVLAAVALLLGGLVPASWLSARGSAAERLVGLQLASAVTVLVLLLVVQAQGQPSYLVVPTVLVPLSAAGTLVFTRVLAPRPPARPPRDAPGPAAEAGPAAPEQAAG